MAFEPKKFNELYEDMRGRSTSALTDFEVGSVTRTMYESFAYELGLLYQKMNLVYLSGFVDSAEGSHLDNVVSVLGIQRSLPDYAVGKVSFIRDKVATDITIPVGTLVATEETPTKPKKVYTTIETLVLSKEQTQAEVSVQALERGQEQNADAETIVVMPRPIVGIKNVSNTEGVKLIGRLRETDDELRRRAKNALLSSGKANRAALENAVLALQGVLDVRIIERFEPTIPDKNYGMVEVIVDAPDYDKIRDKVVEAIENVRAAGVYANIRSSEKTLLSGVFQIEVAGQQQFTDIERTAFETKVREAIEDFLRQTKMGQPLLFSKMMKAILSVEGVEDLQKFALIAKKQDGTESAHPAASSNKIDATELERFYARDKDVPLIFVASENKKLPVNVSFKGSGLTKAKLEEVKKAINAFFKTLPIDDTTLDVPVIGDPNISAQKIQEAIIANVPDANSVVFQPMSWREKPPFTQFTGTATYKPSFVERAELKGLFGYHTQLNIEGVFLLAVPDNTTDEDKTTIRADAQTRITKFLAELPPETNVIIEELVTDIKKIKNVLDVQFAEKDWVIKTELVQVFDRLTSGKIEVKAFEKAFLSNFLVATDKTSVTVTLGTVTILIRKAQNYPDSRKPTDASLFGDAIKTFFANLKQGENVKFSELQNALQAVSIGYTFTISTLSIVAGTQSASLTDIKELKMRLMETAILKQPISPIIISVEAP